MMQAAKIMALAAVDLYSGYLYMGARQRRHNMPEGKKVLIVEDDVDFASTLSMALKLRKHSIELARNGVEALRIAQEKTFDVCILDIRMPGMNGIECLQKIKKILPEKTQYIMMTGFRDKETLEQAEDAGPSHILLKPFTMKAFINCVEGMAH